MRAIRDAGLGARRRPSTRGPQRSARAVDRGLPRVLGALRRDVGVPGAAAGARGGAATPTWGAGSSSNAADFAYPPDGLTLDRVAEIRHMRERIERERVKPPEAAKFHFKLGIGSLADVQFAVELSLMRFGGAHPEIRTPTHPRGDRPARRGAAHRRERGARPGRGVRVPVRRQERPRDGPAASTSRRCRRPPPSRPRSRGASGTRSTLDRASSTTTCASPAVPAARWSGCSRSRRTP